METTEQKTENRQKYERFMAALRRMEAERKTEEVQAQEWYRNNPDVQGRIAKLREINERPQSAE